MSLLDEITPLVLTYNEEANIERTLAALAWAKRVVVVDSHSTDGTVDRCRRYANVDVCQRPFDGHASQWNFGVTQVTSPWVLSLDADYVVPRTLVDELSTLAPGETQAGFSARFTYCVFGRPLRGFLYPPRVVLFRRDQATYVQDGHTQRLSVTGTVGALAGRLLHDDRKSVDRWCADQRRYAAMEAQHLTETPRDRLSRLDRVRRDTPFAPALVALYVLFVRGAILDGWRGWYYAAQRTFAELLLCLLLIDRRLRSSSSAR